jgi:hypothetical protein
MAMAMATHTKTEPTPAHSNDCFVALLDVRELQNNEYVGHLSVAERGKYMSLPRQSRKREWLAGRLAAKYLFLHRLELTQETRGRRQRPALSKLSTAALAVYSPWMYQQVEVLASGGKPSLVWCGKERAESISISHAGGVSCACLAFGVPATLDVEIAVPRRDAFYRKTFTEAESAWVARGADGEVVRANWYFTLLWTLKEAAAKSGWLKQASLWNLPRIEIGSLPAPDQIRPFWRSSTMDDAFALFTARIKEDRRALQVQVAVAGTRNFVLTVMNPQTGAAN